MPFVPGSYDAEDVDFDKGKWGRLGEVAEKIRERVVGSFEVREWGLFGEGE